MKRVSIISLVSYISSPLLTYRAGSVFVTYLAVGLAHGTGKGEKGLDRLPNSDFWQELPHLVKVKR